MSSIPRSDESTPSPSWLPAADALCDTMTAIHQRGWCDGTGGNFSVVLERSPELRLLMAPSGVDKGRVRPGQLIVVNEAGAVVEGNGKVSAEFQLHRAIVRSNGAGAVLHTHSQAATLLSRLALVDPGWDGGGQKAERSPLAEARDPTTEAGAASLERDLSHLEIEGLEMLKGLEGIHTHACRIRLPVLANDQDLNRLSDAATPHLPDAPYGILIAGHGLYAWGQDLQQARRHLEILEFLLEQHWRQRLWNALVTRIR